MVYYALIITSYLLLTSGCVHNPIKRHTQNPGLMSDIYRQSIGDAEKDVGEYVEQHLKEQKVFGYVKPYVPVIEPPVVKKVWIPDHKSEEDSGVLVAGHWVYLMIEGPRWFIEDEVKESVLRIVVPGKEISTENEDKK